MRRVIRAAYLGQDPGDISGLEDPSVIERIGKMRIKNYSFFFQ